MSGTMTHGMISRPLRAAAACATVAGALLALLAVEGCTTIRRARAAQRPSGQQPGEHTTSMAERHLETNTALTVETVIALALTNSPALVEARARLVTAEAQLVQARAGFLPSVSASAGATLSGRAIHEDAGKSYSAGLGLSDDLLSFGRTAAAVREARAALESARASLRAAISSTIADARVAYYGLYRAQELMAVDNASVEDYQIHLDQVRVMADLGTRIRYDVTKAEVDLGNARLAALTARNDMLTARATLARAIGLAESLPGAITAPPAAETNLGDRATLVRLAFTNNPSLQALRASAAAASAAVDAAVADLYPDLSLSASFGYGGSHFPLARSWSLGPSLDWNAFSGWRRTSAVDAAVASLRAARAAVADREQLLQQDLTTAFASLDTALDKATLVELLVRQARENLDLIRERYRLGLATSVELTDAEVAVTQTRSQQVEAQYAEWVSLVQIRSNAGLD